MAGPTAKWTHKGLSVAAWANDRGVSFTIQKRYKDKKTEEWKESKYYYPDDLKQLYTLLGEALKFIHRAPEPDNSIPMTNTVQPQQRSLVDDDDIPF